MNVICECDVVAFWIQFLLVSRESRNFYNSASLTLLDNWAVYGSFRCSRKL